MVSIETDKGGLALPFVGDKRLLFVTPRFGEEIGGGAETLVGGLAGELKKNHVDVTVWTTCARDHRTWENAYPPGAAQAHGVSVERFPVNSRNLDIWIPLQLRIADGVALTVEEELLWMEHFVNSDALYSALHRRGQDFDAIFFAPYMFATTFWGSQIHPDRSILVPCLHDETYAYLQVMKAMFRAVRGCVFNARAERDLARRLYGPIKGEEVGMGFEQPSGFGSDRQVPVDSPYLLYVGRKEAGKNLPLLVEFFTEAKESGRLSKSLKLVILGGGSLDDCGLGFARTRGDVIDLDHAPEEMKRAYLQHALAVCQPSINESFSIVIMEAWRAGSPVIVHGDCAVTSDHVLESGGGLYFRNSEEFLAVVSLLIERPSLRLQLASGGQDYVARKYSWHAVLSRFDRVVANILGAT